MAIKVMSVEASTITVAEFKNEADIMRRLSHRNIIAYYGITESIVPVSGFCMIMEYMSNDSLFSYLKENRNRPLCWAEKVDIALDIATGVAFLHRLRVVHRDLKLGNVLLDSLLHAKIADFGLSFTKTSNHSVYALQEAGTTPYMVKVSL